MSEFIATKMDESRRNDVLFVVPHYLDAERLNKELPSTCMAIAPGTALQGRGFKTIIVLRSTMMRGPDALAWGIEHEDDWLDVCVRTRLLPQGVML